jgi:hypothetical protein
MTNKPYEEIETISPRELIERLEGVCEDASSANFTEEFPCFIKYTLGNKQIKLPVIVRYDDSRLNGRYNLGLFTAFTNEFDYDLSIGQTGSQFYPKKSKTLFGDYTKHLNRKYGRRKVETIQSGDLNYQAQSLRPARVVGEHLSKYRKGMKAGKFKNYK